VPADGFYEWVGAKDSRRPIWFHAPDDGLLYLAGLYETWRDPSIEGADNRQRTFTILTTVANEVVAPVHDRMPVILPPQRVDDWLHVPAANTAAYAADLRGLLAPAPAGALVATEVSRRANSVANDDEACLTPAVGELIEAPRLL
jgi:putative SOS response-associated peptidase YedK